MTFGASILGLISMFLSAITFLLIIWIIMGYLFAFNVIKRGGVAMQIYGQLGSFFAPLLAPFRDLQAKIMPNMRQIDLSPIFLVIVIWWLQSYLIGSFLMRMVS